MGHVIQAGCAFTGYKGRLALNAQLTATVEEVVLSQHHELWDAQRLGGIVLGARRGAGYSRMADLIIDLQRHTGVRVSENTLYDVENGKRLPSLITLTALQITLGIRPEDLTPAIVEPHREDYRKLVR